MLNTDAYPRGETTEAEQSRWTLGYAGCCHGGGCSDVCVCVEQQRLPVESGCLNQNRCKTCIH